MQVWVASMVHPNDMQHAHEAMDNAPNILFTITPSQQPILPSITSFKFRFLHADHAPFLTLSPRALSRMKLGHINPLTFHLPNESIRLNNLFLLGLTFCISLITDQTATKLQRLVREMGGFVQSNSNVDFLVSAEPIQVTSRGMVVRSTWIEAVWASDT
jgi:hypothetical protein